jgi:hypothetical protein
MTGIPAQLTQLKWMQDEAARCWEESKKPRRKEVRTEKPDGTVITEIWTEDQLGDVRYLDVICKCLAEEQAILWPNGLQEQELANELLTDSLIDDLFQDEPGSNGLAADSELPPRLTSGA